MKKEKIQKELNAREFRKILMEHGFTYCSHANSSHEKWKNLDTGESFVFPVNSKPICRFITEKFQRNHSKVCI